MKNKIVTLTIYFVILSHTIFASYVWVQHPTTSSLSRERAAGFSIGDNLYFGSGYINNLAQTDFWEYNSLTGTWTQIADIIGGRHGAVGFSNNGKGYICLGHNHSGAIFFNDLQEYDPVANVWTTKAPFPLSGRYGATVFVIDNVAYLQGGNSGSASGPYSNNLHAYDFATNSWSVKAVYPGTLSYYRVSFQLANLGYVGSGISLNNGVYTFYDDFYSYNPVSDSWSPIAAYPGGNWAAMTAIVFQQKAFVGLGTNTTQPPNSDFYFFDPNSGTWGPGPAFTSGSTRAHGVGMSTSSRGFLGTGLSFGNSLDDLWELTEIVSLDQTADGKSVSIFYNNGFITVSGAKGNLGSIEVFNASGQRVALLKDTNVFTAENLPHGVYIVCYSESNKMLVSKKLLIH